MHLKMKESEENMCTHQQNEYREKNYVPFGLGLGPDLDFGRQEYSVRNVMDVPTAVL